MGGAAAVEPSTPPTKAQALYGAAPDIGAVAKPQQTGGAIRGTIDIAKFVFAILFLLSVGTCVFVCGSAGKAAHEAGQK